MQVQVLARPNVTKWGKFSLTVQSIRPVGKGSIKKSFELLRQKLAGEGLFDDERKRTFIGKSMDLISVHPCSIIR